MAKKSNCMIFITLLLVSLSSLLLTGGCGSSSSSPGESNKPVVPVFPGAEGFGTNTPAGRGGRIIEVTNLNDSGPGSLREALSASGPRIIVFDVGGVINLQSDLVLSHGYCTVAGQTAPGDGIMLKGRGLRITGSDILLQHITIRVGDDGKTKTGAWDDEDCLQIIGDGDHNIVIDHVSVSWSIDENMSIWASGVHDVTFSNNIIAEGLDNSVHTLGPNSKGLLIGGDGNNPKNVAVLDNLFVSNVDRNPQMKGGTSTVIANNLVYNSGDAYSMSNMTRNYVSELTLASYLGNVFKDGPDNGPNSYAIKAEEELWPGSMFNAVDNVNLSRPSFLIVSHGFEVATAPIAIPDFTPLPSSSVMNAVLANAGARAAARDAVDARLVSEVINGGGSRKDHSSGLWPTYVSATRSFAPYIPANPNGDDNGDGYTNIEEILHQMAAQVEGR